MAYPSTASLPMDRSERFYLIRQRLGCQRSVSTRQLLDELEVSPATFLNPCSLSRKSSLTH